MSLSKYLYLQVGSGLSGIPSNSYVLYDARLVDDCLQVHSPGCKRTIAFWVKVSNRTSKVYVLSTVRTVDDRNVPNNVGNSGVVFYTLKREMFVDLYINGVVHVLEYSTNFLNPGSWYHIAFAYSGDTNFRGYINFEWKLNNRALFSRPKLTAEPFLSSGYLENQTQGSRVKLTGFGTIDELLVFPDLLSAPQIAQLNQTSD